jgi:hypothetical protein
MYPLQELSRIDQSISVVGGMFSGWPILALNQEGWRPKITPVPISIFGWALAK